MTTHNVNIVVSSKGTVTVKKEIEEIGKGARTAATGVDFLKGALTALVSIQTVKTIVGITDAWSDMQSRVGAAVKDMDAAPQLMQRMVDIANASYSPLDKTVEVYARNVAVLKDLGHNADKAADFTEALNHAMVTTATKGQDADVVLNALSRAISTGSLRAMEYETIMSRSPRVLEAVAKEAGVTTTGLLALAKQGKITGDTIVNGLVKSLEMLRKEAGDMPATIGDAIVRIQTNFMALLGTLDQTYGASGRVAEALIWVADNLTTVMYALSPLIASLTFYAVQVVGSLVINAMTSMITMVTGAARAFIMLNAAIIANPIVATIVAIGVAVAGVIVYFGGWEAAVQKLIIAWSYFLETWERFFGTEAGVNRAIEIRINAAQAVEDLKKAGGELKAALGLGGTDIAKKVETGSKNGADMMKAGIEAGAGNAGNALIAKYEQLNGKVIKPMGDVLIDGGNYIHNQVTGAVTKAGSTMQGGIESGGNVAANAMQSAVQQGGEAAGASFKAAGIELSGWLVDYFVNKLGHIMSHQLRLTQSEANLNSAEARKLNAEARAIATAGRDRSHMYSSSGVSNSYSAPSPSTSSQSTSNSGTTTEVKNVIDPSGMVDALDTDMGHKQIVNVIKYNREELRAILGAV